MKTIDVSQLYQETAGFYAGIQSQLVSVRHDYKYRLLYGPAFARPPILWIGFQPGGCKHNRRDLVLPVSGVCDFAVAPRTLAKRMRWTFPVKLLARCVAVNAIFIRSPNITRYKRTLSPALRGSIFSFCRARIEGLIWRLDPRLVVVYGLATLDLFDKAPGSVRPGKNGKDLIRCGKIGDRRVLGVRHLSGCRLSKSDRNLITSYILSVIV
jgi:hypothetical protein